MLFFRKVKLQRTLVDNMWCVGVGVCVKPLKIVYTSRHLPFSDCVNNIGVFIDRLRNFIQILWY